MNNENDVIMAYGKESVDRMTPEQKEYVSEKIAYMKLEEERAKAYREERRLAGRPRRRVRNPINPTKPIVRKEAKIGRNEPCPCGSGKKYKKCCGK